MNLASAPRQAASSLTKQCLPLMDYGRFCPFCLRQPDLECFEDGRSRDCLAQCRFDSIKDADLLLVSLDEALLGRVEG